MSRIEAMNSSGSKQMVKTWSACVHDLPEMVGHTIAVHDGRKHVPVFVSESMVGTSSASSPRPGCSAATPAGRLSGADGDEKDTEETPDEPTVDETADTEAAVEEPSVIEEEDAAGAAVEETTDDELADAAEASPEPEADAEEKPKPKRRTRKKASPRPRPLLRTSSRRRRRRRLSRGGF